MRAFPTSTAMGSHPRPASSRAHPSFREQEGSRPVPRRPTEPFLSAEKGDQNSGVCEELKADLLRDKSKRVNVCLNSQYSHSFRMRSHPFCHEDYDSFPEGFLR